MHLGSSRDLTAEGEKSLLESPLLMVRPRVSLSLTAPNLWPVGWLDRSNGRNSAFGLKQRPLALRDTPFAKRACLPRCGAGRAEALCFSRIWAWGKPQRPKRSAGRRGRGQSIPLGQILMENQALKT